MSGLKVVVLLSGGMDSTVLLHHYLKADDHVRALGFNYGQRHGNELSFAYLTAQKLGVPYEEVDLGDLRRLLPGSSQTDNKVPVPEGHYTESSMKTTVVPNRNMIMLSIAIGHAIAHKFDYVAFAAHAGDHAIYPDCRRDFVDVMDHAAGKCDYRRIGIRTPFINHSKKTICKMGSEWGVDFTQTWSCYKGGSLHCGRCGTCVERREAFYLAGIKDPTLYEKTAPSVDILVKNNWRL